MVPPRIAGDAARTGHDVHAGRHLAVDQQRFARGGRSLLDDLQLEQAVERMISFARSTSVTPGSCTRI